MSEQSPKEDYHDQWEDVSDETGHNHHWHHVSSEPGEFRSIRLVDESVEFLSLYADGWTLELYPDPNNNGNMTRWRFPPDEYDDPEKAAKEKVREIMEEHA